jgi:hypothetical protein
LLQTKINDISWFMIYGGVAQFKGHWTPFYHSEHQNANKFDENKNSYNASLPTELVPVIINPLRQPSIIQPSIIKTGITQPAIIKPAIIQPAVIQPAVIQPGIIQPAIIKPAIIQPAIIQPAIIQPAVIQPAVIQPAIIQHGIIHISSKSITTGTHCMIYNSVAYSYIDQLLVKELQSQMPYPIDLLYSTHCFNFKSHPVLLPVPFLALFDGETQSDVRKHKNISNDLELCIATEKFLYASTGW